MCVRLAAENESEQWGVYGDMDAAIECVELVDIPPNRCGYCPAPAAEGSSERY